MITLVQTSSIMPTVEYFNTQHLYNLKSVFGWRSAILQRKSGMPQSMNQVVLVEKHKKQSIFIFGKRNQEFEQ